MITDDERRLSERLWTLPLPASTVDVAAAVATGRRVRRTRAAAAGALAVVAVLGIGAVVRMRPAPDTAPATSGACRGERLPLPTGVYLDDIVDVDPTGRYVVGTVRSIDNTVTEVVRWDGRGFTVVPGDGRRSPTMVTAGGVVLGLGEGGGFRYADGRVTRLPVPAGYRYVTPRWLTGTGDPAGFAFEEGVPTARVVWTEGQPRDVTPVTTDVHQRTGDDGTSVWLSPDRRRLAVSTAAGARRELAVPAGFRPVHVFGVAGEWAVGVVQPENDPPVQQPRDLERVVAVRWNLSTGAVEWQGGPGTVTTGVAVDGTMLVRTRDRVQTIRYPDGTTRRLAPPDGLTLSMPVLSEDGATVAAAAVFPGDPDRGERTQAVVFHC